MIIIFHILVALSSLVYTGYLFLRPSKPGFYISYALVAATLASGTYLVVKQPTHMTQTCTEGLVYLAVIAFGILAAHKKLIVQQHAKHPLV